jgi:5'-nucleotidase/UDP-sugar diphosphatase
MRFLLTTAAAALIAGSATTANAEFTLHVLHINDVHNRLQPINRFDSTCNAEDDAAGECFGGWARMQAALDMKRAELEGENVIFLDAGDHLQGSLMFTTYNGDATAEMIAALAPDVLAVGNHEFNKGPGNLARVIDMLEGIPVVSGNLDLSGSEELRDKIETGAHVLEVGGMQVGIVSALATDTAETSSPGPNVVFMDEVEALQQDVAQLQEQGVDIILALTHVGLPTDLVIAEQVEGIDAVIGGHSHTLFGEEFGGEPYPTDVNGTPVVQAYAYSKYLGHLTLTFDDDGALVSAEGAPMLLDASIEPDADVAARVAELVEPIAEMQERVVAEAAEAIEGSREVCRAMECAMGNLVADAMLDRVADQGVQIAFQNGGGLRASIDAGEITMGEVVTVLPFQNTLSTFEVTGATLVEALENGVSQVEEGAGRFPQVAGMSFEVDLSQEPGSRISNVMVGGEPIDMDATYSMVSNNYVRNGGDGYGMFVDAMNAYDYGPDLADVTAEFLAANAPYQPYTDGRITMK